MTGTVGEVGGAADRAAAGSRAALPLLGEAGRPGPGPDRARQRLPHLSRTRDRRQPRVDGDRGSAARDEAADDGPVAGDLDREVAVRVRELHPQVGAPVRERDRPLEHILERVAAVDGGEEMEIRVDDRYPALVRGADEIRARVEPEGRERVVRDVHDRRQRAVTECHLDDPVLRNVVVVAEEHERARRIECRVDRDADVVGAKRLQSGPVVRRHPDTVSVRVPEEDVQLAVVVAHTVNVSMRRRRVHYRPRRAVVGGAIDVVRIRRALSRVVGAEPNEAAALGDRVRRQRRVEHRRARLQRQHLRPGGPLIGRPEQRHLPCIDMCHQRPAGQRRDVLDVLIRRQRQHLRPGRSTIV